MRTLLLSLAVGWLVADAAIAGEACQACRLHRGANLRQRRSLRPLRLLLPMREALPVGVHHERSQEDRLGLSLRRLCAPLPGCCLHKGCCGCESCNAGEACAAKAACCDGCGEKCNACASEENKCLVPPKCGKVRERTYLEKKEICCTVPCYKCVVVYCCPHCSAQECGDEGSAPAPVNQAPPAPAPAPDEDHA